MLWTRLPLSNRSSCGAGPYSRCAAPEFGVGHHQCRVPAAEFLQGRLERDQALGQLLEQLGLLSRLILVGIKAIQADPHRGNASLTGNHLRGCAHGVAKLAIGKLGAQWRTGAKLARGLDDLAFDLENMRERRVAALRR